MAALIGKGCAGSSPPATTDSQPDTSAHEDSGSPDHTEGSAGCGAETFASGTYTLEHEGLTRTSRLFVPASHDPETPAPLVPAFHGWGGDEDTFPLQASKTPE